MAILNSLNSHNFTIFQPILMILVSKFMVHGALSDKTYLSLGLLSPLRVRLARHKTGLSPPVKYFIDRSKAVLLLWIFNVFFSVLRL